MIDIIFYIINSAALCYVVVYLFRRFASESIRQSMAFEQASQSNMIKRQDSLRKQEQGLVRAYYHHNYLYEELSHKVDLWRRRVDELQNKQAREHEVIAEQVTQRSLEQQRYAHAKLLYQQAIPLASERAEEELKRFFAAQQERSHYMQRIMHRLQQGDL